LTLEVSEHSGAIDPEVPGELPDAGAVHVLGDKIEDLVILQSALNLFERDCRVVLRLFDLRNSGKMLKRINTGWPKVQELRG